MVKHSKPAYGHVEDGVLEVEVEVDVEVEVVVPVVLPQVPNAGWQPFPQYASEDPQYD